MEGGITEILSYDPEAKNTCCKWAFSSTSTSGSIESRFTLTRSLPMTSLPLLFGDLANRGCRALLGNSYIFMSLCVSGEAVGGGGGGHVRAWLQAIIVHSCR